MRTDGLRSSGGSRLIKLLIYANERLEPDRNSHLALTVE